MSKLTWNSNWQDVMDKYKTVEAMYEAYLNGTPEQEEMEIIGAKFINANLLYLYAILRKIDPDTAKRLRND